MFCAWLASHILSEDKAKIAAFSFTLGMFVTGRPLQFANASDGVALAVGGLFGLAFVWFQFFGREVARG